MSDPSSATPRPNRQRRTLLAVALVLLIGLSFAGFRFTQWFSPRSTDTTSLREVPDPRVAYDGPYRNIHPDVGYVGDAQCAGCHDEILRSYARHPMGRSLVGIEKILDRQQIGADVNNPFYVLGRRFQVDREGQRLWHRQALLDNAGKPVVELAQEVRWVIGSGAKGYSYLTERDGFLFQTPISWFTQKRRWDLSPGFGPDVLAGRLVTASCLFCHANYFQEHPEQPDRLRTPVEMRSIGCERCHGPGERHVQTGDRWDIVNPDRLPPPLRDAVCEQCHLEGEARILRAGRKLFDYRPGLPLQDFWAVLVQSQKSGEEAKAVNHVEQMYQSRCFARPVGGLKMGCATCHDPHVAIGPSERHTHYRAKCLNCHDETAGQQGCSEPLLRRKQTSPKDSCIDCHMPRYQSSDIAHTASTDHRIVRRPDHRGVTPADPDRADFVDFYWNRFSGSDPQMDRTLGLGLVKMMHANMLQPQRHGDKALRYLERALGRDPSDASVREGKVALYLLLQRPAEALSEAQVILPEQPGNWRLLAEAAIAAEAGGQIDAARVFMRRAVVIDPFEPDYQVLLIRLLMKAGELDEARKHCEQLLRWDPFNVSGRRLWKEIDGERQGT